MKYIYLEYDNKKSLINSLLVLILGVILFTNPMKVLNMVSVLFSVFIGVIGLIRLATYLYNKKKGQDDKKLLAISIIILVSAIIVLFLATFIEVVIRLVIGMFIIYTSIMRIIETINNRKTKDRFLVGLIISVLMVICGFWILLSVGFVYKTIGIFMIIFSVLDIIGYITYNKNKKNNIVVID